MTSSNQQAPASSLAPAEASSAPAYGWSESIPALMDWERETRTGLPEAVYCTSKSVKQIAGIVLQAQSLERRLLLTRLSEEKWASLPDVQRASLDYSMLSQTAILGPIPSPVRVEVGIIAAGIADMPFAEEAARTLAFCGVGSAYIADVGVAGLWRLMERLDEIRRFRVLIAAAGMEGALFSVLGGLVSAPIVALPTPVGEGVAAGGQVALHSALASCAPGLLTVNIGNGFGAAQAVQRILALSR